MSEQTEQRGAKGIFARMFDLAAVRLRNAQRNVREAVVLEVNGGEPGTEYNPAAYLPALQTLADEYGLDRARHIFAVNEQVYRERCRLHRIAVRLPELQKEADLLEAEWRAADVAEADRHREALRKLEVMKNEARLAVDAASEAVGAQADLIAGADVKHEEALTKATSLVGQLEVVREKLDTSDREAGDHRNTVYWGSVAERPALLERQTKQMLAARNTSLSPQRRAELQKQYEAARDETKRCREELAKLEAEHAGLMKQATWSEEEAMRPENFRLRMPQLSADEQRRRHAKRFGFMADDPGFAISRG